MPEWMQHLIQLGSCRSTPRQAVTFSSFGFLRDGVLLSLPVGGGLPSVFVYFAAAGMSPLRWSVRAPLQRMGNVVARMWSTDVVGAAAAHGRVHVGRLAIAGAAGGRRRALIARPIRCACCCGRWR